MERETESQDGGSIARDRLGRALTLVNECYDNLFEHSPVMLHSLDQYWRLAAVNRKWLENMGYQAGDVLGRRSIDFLAEDSRAVAVSETLPLFWRTGSARNISYQMIRNDGRTLDVILDADLDTDSNGTRRTLEALRVSRGKTDWQYSMAILPALLGLTRVGRAIEAILAGGLSASVGASSEYGDSPGQAVFGGQTESLDDLRDAVKEASASLHAVGSILAGSAYPLGARKTKWFCWPRRWWSSAENFPG